MNVMVPIPDDLAARFGSEAELGRRAVEALALEEYRAGRLTHIELGQLLGLETKSELNNLLAARGVAQPHLQQSGAAQSPEAEHAAANELVEQFRTFRAGKTLGGLDIKALIAEGRR